MLQNSGAILEAEYQRGRQFGATCHPYILLWVWDGYVIKRYDLCSKVGLGNCL